VTGNGPGGLPHTRPGHELPRKYPDNSDPNEYARSARSNLEVDTHAQIGLFGAVDFAARSVHQAKGPGRCGNRLLAQTTPCGVTQIRRIYLGTGFQLEPQQITGHLSM
jgi:hypothetical protein